jgi:hypothetical protein
MTFPRSTGARSTPPIPIKCLNGEIKRRTEVAGIFPNEATITRLIGAILLEQNDGWAVIRRYMMLESIALLSDDTLVKLPIVAALLPQNPTDGRRSYTTPRSTIFNRIA